MINISSQHTNACFQAWIKCENLLKDIQSVKKFLSGELEKVIDDCAYICMGTFHALKSGSVNIRNMALLCVGVCEECAEMCESYNGDHFKSCARICRQCADTMSDFTYHP